jgi:hypothetical protein
MGGRHGCWPGGLEGGEEGGEGSELDGAGFAIGMDRCESMESRLCRELVRSGLDGSGRSLLERLEEGHR